MDVVGLSTARANIYEELTLFSIPVFVPLFQINQIPLLPGLLDLLLELGHFRLSIFQRLRRGKKRQWRSSGIEVGQSTTWGSVVV
jgi:hypothetical protein